MLIEISYSATTTYRQQVEVADGMDRQAIDDYAQSVVSEDGATEGQHETSYAVELDEWTPITPA